MNEKTVTLSIKNLTKTIKLQVHQQEELVSRTLFKQQCWEPFETELILTTLKPGQNALDIGANIGYYSVLMAEITGSKGRVLAFEPEEKNFQLLKRNIELNKQQHIISAQAVGLSDNTQQAKLHLSASNFGDHRLFSDNKDQKSKQNINLTKGDEINEIKNQTFHFIKIDTQGSELAIIKGLKHCLKQNAAHLSLIVECWPYALRENGGSYHELIQLLSGLNLNLYLIDHINEKLIPHSKESLIDWCEQCLDNQHRGFCNLFVTAKKVNN